MELTTFRFLYARLVNDCFPVNLRVDVLQQTPACMWTRGGSGAAQQFSQPAKSSGFVGTHCALADKRDPDHLDDKFCHTPFAFRRSGPGPILGERREIFPAAGAKHYSAQQENVAVMRICHRLRVSAS